MAFNKIKKLFAPNTLTLLRNSKNYFSAKLIISVVSFLSLPIITRLLTPEDYGIVSLFTSFASVFTILFLLSISSAIKVNYIKKDFPHGEYLFSNVIFLLIINIIFVLLVYLFKRQLELTFNLPGFIIFLAALTSMGNVFLQMKIGVLHGQQRSRLASFLDATENTSIILVSLLVIYLMTKNLYLGQIYTELVIAILFAIYSFFALLRESKPRFKFAYVKDALKFGLPLTPHAISGFILHFSDQIIINQLVGVAKTGIYSFAYKIGNLMNMLVASMNIAWQPIYWEYIKNEKWNAINALARKYAKYVYLAAIFFICFSKEITMLLSEPSYYESVQIIPVIILSYVFLFLYTLFSGISFYEKRTGLISINTLIAAAINIGLNYWLIPKYGYQIAAWTTLFSFACLFGLHYINSKFVLKYNKLRVKSVMPDFFVLLLVFIIHYALSSINLGVWTMLAIKIILPVLASAYLFRKNIFVKIKGIKDENE